MLNFSAICHLPFAICIAICNAQAPDIVEYVFDDLKKPVDIGVLAQGSSGRVHILFENSTGRRIVISSTFGSCACLEIQPTNSIVPPGGKLELRVKVATSKVGKFGFSGGIVFTCGESGEAKVMKSTFQLTYTVPKKSAFPSESLPVRMDPFRPKSVSLVMENPWKYELHEPQIRMEADVGEATIVRSDKNTIASGQEFRTEIVFSELFLAKLKTENQDVALVLLAKQSLESLVYHELDSMVLNVSADSGFAVKGVQINFVGDTANVSFNVLQSSKNDCPLSKCDFELKLSRESDPSVVDIISNTNVISARWVALECSCSNVGKRDKINMKISYLGEQLGTVVVPISRQEK